MSNSILFNFSLAGLNNSTVDMRRDFRRAWIANDIRTYVASYLTDSFVKHEDLMLLEWGLCLIDTFKEKFSWIVEDHINNPGLYEAINLKRLLTIVDEIPVPLKKNYEDLKHTSEVQESLNDEVAMLVREIREARTQTELKEIGRKGYELMCSIANHDQHIQPELKINEAHKAHIADMATRFKEGYVYHISMEQELKKVSFEKIYATLSPKQQKKFHEVRAILEQIQGSVRLAYSLNLRQVALIKRVYSIMYEEMQKKQV